jgi:hypothetical protein
MRARVAVTVLSFFSALAATSTPVLPAAAAERAPALGGEAERTPYVASDASAVPLRAVRDTSSARPGFWKLPPHALTLRIDATPVAWARALSPEVAQTPVAPPSAPRSCRGPPRTT